MNTLISRFLITFAIVKSIDAQLVGQGLFPQQQQAQFCPPQYQQAISQCAQELRAMGVFQNQNEINALTSEQIRRRSRQYYQQICDSYRRFSACVSPYKQSCWYQEPIKAEFSVVSESLEYMCGEAYYGILNNWECYVQVSSREEVVQCEARLLAETRRLGSSDFSAPSNNYYTMRDEATCRRLQDYMSCIREPIYSQCGQQGWDYIREAVQRPVRVYMPDCLLAASSIIPSVFLLTFLAVYALYNWNHID